MKYPTCPFCQRQFAEQALLDEHIEGKHVFTLSALIQGKEILSRTNTEKKYKVITESEAQHYKIKDDDNFIVTNEIKR